MLEYRHKNELFIDEMNILRLAQDDLRNEVYSDNELFHKYEVLVQNYEKLLKSVDKLIRNSDFQDRELKRRECEIRTILNNCSQGFLTFGRNLIVNKEHSLECVRLFGKEISNICILELLKSENNPQNELFSSVFTGIFNKIDEEDKLLELRKLPNILKINNSYVSISYKFVHNEQDYEDKEYIMLTLTDITEKKRTEDQITYFSYHDKLTSLFNRAYIESVTSQLQTAGNMPLSVIMADMNGLKLTNDIFGHENGDKLIINAANIFMKCCSNTDIVARWGGDEFLVILPNTDSSTCKKICASIQDMCREVEAQPIELSISLGSATMERTNTNISKLFNTAEKIMYSNKFIENKKIRRKILLSFEKTLSKKCLEDKGHVHRVKNMALRIGRFFNIEPDSIEMLNLTMLASLHDIGKVAIPEEILSKEGELTRTEWEVVKSYTEIGFRMAQSIEEPILAQSILCLRERWDGKGYPYGLKGENIPINSRIMSIIDSYDVMTHDRPYRKGMSREEALQEIKRCSGTQYDPSITDIFIKLEKDGDI